MALLAGFILEPISCSSANAQPDGSLIDNGVQRQWRLSIETDAFSDEKRCRLRSHDGKIRYLEKIVGFRLGSTHDLSESWFRIDNGTALRWRDQRPELARLRPGFDERAIGSLESGWLWLPLTLFEDARQISIATGFGAKVQSFRLDGLSAQLRNARERGCLPEDRFVF
jgi:hypothetical protein